MNYQTADAQLTGRNHSSRKIARNTYLKRRDGNDIAILFHETDVVTFHPNGTLTLNSGGYLTMSTRDRMNYADIFVYTDSGRWYVSFPDHDTGWPTCSDAAFPYFDGIVLNPAARSVVNPQDGPDVAAEDLINADTRKKIRAYVALYTDETIRDLVADAAANGVGGDCWFCLGIASDDSDHLFSHMEEEYVMASLARNALEAKGYTDPVYILHIGGRLVRDAIARYLRKSLLVGCVVTR